MATDADVLGLIAATGAIELTGQTKPTFKVNFEILRNVLRPEQEALAGNFVADPRNAPEDRQISGSLSLDAPGGGQTSIPTTILIGRDGTDLRDGFPAILHLERVTGRIMIAVGGNGHTASGQDLRATDGAGVYVGGGSENLIIALGGVGGGSFLATRRDGGNGGFAIAVGIGRGNDLYADGGIGGPGNVGASGRRGYSSILFGVRLATAGGTGGGGGKGGRAEVTGGEDSFALASGAAGGTGGPGGPGGSGAGPYSLDLGLFTINSQLVLPGIQGPGGVGGDGGNIKITVGANSVISAATNVGAGGRGGAGSGPGASGKPGVIEP